MKRKIGLVLVLVLIIFQFFQPKKNESSMILAEDITKVTNIPKDVLTILKTSCFDCHSNKTAYPWYYTIQPLSWWLNNHIKEGKGKLNFSEFGNYTAEKAIKKLHEIEEVIIENEMPLTSYTLIHRNAKLDAKQRKLLANWTKNVVINKNGRLKISLH